MNCLEKFQIKHYDNLQTTQPQEKEINAIQSSFTETLITYKKCNAMKLSVPKIETKTSIDQKNLNKSLKKRKSEKHIKLF